MSDKIRGGSLSPAYGRDYASRAAIVADLNAGKDFVLNSFNGSGYCGLSDLANGAHQVRYAKLRKVASVTVADGIAR